MRPLLTLNLTDILVSLALYERLLSANASAVSLGQRAPVLDAMLQCMPFQFRKRHLNVL
jgi:hypothetical protein